MINRYRYIIYIRTHAPSLSQTHTRALEHIFYLPTTLPARPQPQTPAPASQSPHPTGLRIHSATHTTRSFLPDWHASWSGRSPLTLRLHRSAPFWCSSFRVSSWPFAAPQCAGLQGWRPEAKVFLCQGWKVVLFCIRSYQNSSSWYFIYCCLKEKPTYHYLLFSNFHLPFCRVCSFFLLFSLQDSLVFHPFLSHLSSFSPSLPFPILSPSFRILTCALCDPDGRCARRDEGAAGYSQRAPAWRHRTTACTRYCPRCPLRPRRGSPGSPNSPGDPETPRSAALWWPGVVSAVEGVACVMNMRWWWCAYLCGLLMIYWQTTNDLPITITILIKLLGQRARTGHCQKGQEWDLPAIRLGIFVFTGVVKANVISALGTPHKHCSKSKSHC